MLFIVQLRIIIFQLVPAICHQLKSAHTLVYKLQKLIIQNFFHKNPLRPLRIFTVLQVNVSKRYERALIS